MASSSKRPKTSKSKQTTQKGRSSKKIFMDAPFSLQNTVKDIVLDIKTFSSICCDIPMVGDIIGFSLVCDWDDYDRKRFYLSIRKIPKEERKKKGESNKAMVRLLRTRISSLLDISRWKIVWFIIFLPVSFCQNFQIIRKLVT
ncbi:hypothetical protein Lal_00032004 [Lupinus albus]|nr:hypothetical protein Lal_00032004 [Lupinus albus]